MFVMHFVRLSRGRVIGSYNVDHCIDAMLCGGQELLQDKQLHKHTPMLARFERF